MAKPIKVFFAANGFLKDSPHFKYSFKYPPKGVKYTNADNSDVITKVNNMPLVALCKTLMKTALIINGVSKVKLFSINDKNADLIHSFNMVPETTQPYIIEMESFHSLIFGNPGYSPALDALEKRLCRKNCKKILFWTQNAYNNFFDLIPNSALKKKSIMLYPAVPIKTKNKFNNKPRLGFIARDFDNKGGLLAVQIMDAFYKAGLVKKGIVVSKMSSSDYDNIVKKYDKSIKFMPLVDRDYLEKHVFPKINLMIYPGYSDTFGYIFPESFSYGIPVITIDGCARKELVHDNKGGIVISTELSPFGYLDKRPSYESLEFGLITAITNIIKNKKIWESMSDYNYNLVKSGQFSLSYRNNILKHIYQEAIK